MKIAALKAIPITHFERHGRPLKYLYEQPLNFLFVRVETDEGIVGYGEVCDSYGCNYPLAVRALIEEALGPLLVNEDPLSVERLIFKMRGWTRRRLGDQGVVIQAISGVEVALWDLLGKIEGKPVSRLMGRFRDRVAVYASGTLLEEGPPEWHLKLFEPCLSRGVRAIKVRIGLDFRRDLKTLYSLRSLLGDEVQIMVDGGEHYTTATALKIADALKDIEVLFFEEPIPQCDREGIARLVKKSPVPIAYGEHLFLVHDFQDCLMRRRADVIQPDAAICGGISEARKIAALAETFGAPVAPHSAAGPVALAANLHLSASIPSLLMLEYTFTLDRLWREMLREQILAPEALHGGQLLVPDEPGLGLSIDETVWSLYPYQAHKPVNSMPSWSLGQV